MVFRIKSRKARIFTCSLLTSFFALTCNGWAQVVNCTGIGDLSTGASGNCTVASNQIGTSNAYGLDFKGTPNTISAPNTFTLVGSIYQRGDHGIAVSMPGATPPIINFEGGAIWDISSYYVTTLDPVLGSSDPKNSLGLSVDYAQNVKGGDITISNGYFNGNVKIYKGDTKTYFVETINNNGNITTKNHYLYSKGDINLYGGKFYFGAGDSEITMFQTNTGTINLYDPSFHVGYVLDEANPDNPTLSLTPSDTYVGSNIHEVTVNGGLYNIAAGSTLTLEGLNLTIYSEGTGFRPTTFSGTGTLKVQGTLVEIYDSISWDEGNIEIGYGTVNLYKNVTVDSLDFSGDNGAILDLKTDSRLTIQSDLTMNTTNVLKGDGELYLHDTASAIFGRLDNFGSIRADNGTLRFTGGGSILGRLIGGSSEIYINAPIDIGSVYMDDANFYLNEGMSVTNIDFGNTGVIKFTANKSITIRSDATIKNTKVFDTSTSEGMIVIDAGKSLSFVDASATETGVFTSQGLNLEAREGSAFNFNGSGVDLNNMTLKKGTANFNKGLSILKTLTVGDTGAATGTNAYVNVAQGASAEVDTILALVGSSSVVNGTLTVKDLTMNGTATTWATMSGSGTLRITGTGTLDGYFNGMNTIVIDASGGSSNATANFNGHTGKDKISNLTLISDGTYKAVANLSNNLTVDTLNFDETYGGEVNIAAGATLAIRNTSDISGANATKNVIKGNGTLQLLDNTSINFGGSGNYLGGLKIGTGTATITQDALLGSVTFTTAQGGTLSIDTGKTLEVDTSIITNGSNKITGGGTLKLVGNANGYFGSVIEDLGQLEIGNGTATFNVNSSLSNVVFTAGGTGKIQISDRITVTLATSLNLATTNSIMGDGTLRLTGAANAVLNTGSDYLGTLLIDAGTAQFNADSHVKNIRFSSNSGGSINITSGTTLTVGNYIVTNGTNFVAGTGTLLIDDGATADFGTDMAMISNIRIGNAQVNFNEDSSLQNVSFTSGSGGTIRIAGGKTLTLTQNLTTSGSNNITGAGTLFVGDGLTGTFGAISGLGTLRIGDGSTVSLAQNSSIGNVVFDSTANGVLTIGSGNVLNITNSIVLGGANLLSGSGTLNLVGNASAVFGTSQAFTGLLKIGTGTASFVENTTIGFIDFDSGRGGTIQIDTGKTLTLTNGISTTGSNTITGGGFLVLSGGSIGSFGSTITSLGGLNIGTGMAFFSADANINNITFSSTTGGILSIEAGKNVRTSSDIYTYGTNNITGDGTFWLTGNANATFGSAITGLNGLRIGSGTATFNQNSSIDNIAFTDNAGGINIAGGRTLTVASNLVTNGANTIDGLGTLSLTGNANATFNNAINFAGNLVMAQGTARFNQNSTVGTIQMSGGILDIDASRVQATTVDLGTGSTLALRLKRGATDEAGNVVAGNHGVLEVTDLNVNGASTLRITVDYGLVTKTDGTQFKVVEGNVRDLHNFTLSNNRYEFLYDPCAGGLCYKVIQKSSGADVVDQFGGSQNNKNVAAAILDDRFFEEGSELAKVAEHIDTLSQHANILYLNALTALAPDVTGAMTQQPINIQNKIMNTLSSRMYGLQGSLGQGTPYQQYQRGIGRSGGSPYEYRWMPSKDYLRKAGYTDEVIEPSRTRQKYQRATPADVDYVPESSQQRMRRRIINRRAKHFGLWAQGFYNTTEHISSSNPEGFSSDTTGVALGFDAEIWDNLIMGVGYAHTKTDVDSLQRSTDITANSGFLYTMYKPSDWFVSSVLNYSKSSSDEDKDLSGMLITDSYDGTSYSALLMTGYDMGWVRPAVGLKYASISLDKHVDSVGQNIGSIKNTVFTGILEARFSKDIFSKENRYWRPEVSVGITYDFSSDDNVAVVSLPNGANYRVTGESLDQLAGEIGLSVAYLIGENTDITVGYSGEFRKDYSSHTALLSFRYNF